MKKLFLSAAAVMFAIAAGAQNKAIDALAEKYTDSEGFTIVNLEGEALRSVSSMVANGEGTINIGNGETHKISELLEEIVSATALILRRTDETFLHEVQNAIDSADYSPIVSHNEGGQMVKLVSADIRRGKLRGNKEIVAMIDSKDQTILVRVIGKIDMEMISKIVGSM